MTKRIILKDNFDTLMDIASKAVKEELAELILQSTAEGKSIIIETPHMLRAIVHVLIKQGVHNITYRENFTTRSVRLVNDEIILE